MVTTPLTGVHAFHVQALLIYYCVHCEHSYCLALYPGFYRLQYEKWVFILQAIKIWPMGRPGYEATSALGKVRKHTLFRNLTKPTHEAIFMDSTKSFFAGNIPFSIEGHISLEVRCK